MSVPDLAEARAALRDGDAARARTALAGLAPSPGVDECLARAAYLDLDFPAALAAWERAYAGYRTAGDDLGAVRVARTLGGMYLTVVGDLAVAGGWLARARRLLAGTGDSAEGGWVELDCGMFEADRAERERRFRAALDLGRRHGDRELEFAALAYLGANLVHADRTEEGMVLLDEALAAVAGDEVDDFCVLEEIFCQLFSACEHACDVVRADEWIRVGDALAARRRLPAVSAFCRTHYGGVLTAAGRWPEAEATLTEAVRLWDAGRRSGLRRDALVRLADLRARQGRYEEAEQLLDGTADDGDPIAARALAAAHLGRGRPALAADVLDRALERVEPLPSAAAPLLALLVDAHLASGRDFDAVAAAERLADCAARHPGNPHLAATAALARGRVCLATGTGDPRGCLREALAGFARAELPMEVARARLELAGALVADHPEVALFEARAALDAFERLAAARYADAAVAVLRSLGVRVAAARTTGALTRREAEVLDLLGHGLSNPEIAERLFISRKTVEHHVGNVLAKLGLRSRAEAAAYAARTPAPK